MSAIGIDLGTTNSVAAIARRSAPRVLPNNEGSSLTPSVVSFLKHKGAGEIAVGRMAVNNAGRDPANTVFSIKRLMGRQHGEHRVDEVRGHYAFRLASPPPADSDDQGVKVLLNDTAYTPEDLSAL